MRTTVDIPDRIYKRLKTKAASEGSSVRVLILRGVEFILDVKPQGAPKRVQLPILRSKRPGSRYIDNEMIYDIIGFP